MNKNSSWETSVKPVVVLSVIALIVSLLLAMVNSFTAPIIEENQKAATLAAYVDVMPTVSSASGIGALAYNICPFKRNTICFSCSSSAIRLR